MPEPAEPNAKLCALQLGDVQCSDDFPRRSLVVALLTYIRRAPSIHVFLLVGTVSMIDMMATSTMNTLKASAIMAAWRIARLS